jgi:hypothetical protein
MTFETAGMTDKPDIDLCKIKYDEYLQWAAMQQDPEDMRLLKNIAWSWARLVAQLERYQDKMRKQGSHEH